MPTDSPINLIQALLQRPISFNRAFADIAGGAIPGLFLSQAWYWSQRTQDAEGWFYKTQVEWEEETALIRSEQDRARLILKRLGIMREKLRGQPARLWYSIDYGMLQTRLQDSANKIAESCKLDCRIQQTTRANTGASNLRNSESSAEITTETTFRDVRPPKPPQTHPSVAHTYAETPEGFCIMTPEVEEQRRQIKTEAQAARKTKMAVWDADPLPGSSIATGKRSTRCPPGYMFDSSLRAWAAERYPEVDVDEAIEAMRDWEYKTPRSDWNACLRTWIRNEAKQSSSRGHSRKTVTKSRSVVDELFAEQEEHRYEKARNVTP